MDNNEDNGRFELAFGKINYILMGVGLLLLAVGYLLLSGGGSDNPDVMARCSMPAASCGRPSSSCWASWLKS